MSRTCPNINGARIVGAPTPAFSGGNVVQSASYRVGWYTAPTPPATAPIFHDAPTASPWQKGTGSVAVTVPATTGAQAVQTAVVQAIATAEGLTTGDAVILPDGITVVTLP